MLKMRVVQWGAVVSLCAWAETGFARKLDHNLNLSDGASYSTSMREIQTDVYRTLEPVSMPVPAPLPASVPVPVSGPASGDDTYYVDVTYAPGVVSIPGTVQKIIFSLKPQDFLYVRGLMGPGFVAAATRESTDFSHVMGGTPGKSAALFDDLDPAPSARSALGLVGSFSTSATSLAMTLDLGSSHGGSALSPMRSEGSPAHFSGLMDTPPDSASFAVEGTPPSAAAGGSACDALPERAGLGKGCDEEAGTLEDSHRLMDAIEVRTPPHDFFRAKASESMEWESGAYRHLLGEQALRGFVLWQGDFLRGGQMAMAHPAESSDQRDARRRQNGRVFATFAVGFSEALRFPLLRDRISGVLTNGTEFSLDAPLQAECVGHPEGGICRAVDALVGGMLDLTKLPAPGLSSDNRKKIITAGIGLALGKVDPLHNTSAILRACDVREKGLTGTECLPRCGRMARQCEKRFLDDWTRAEGARTAERDNEKEFWQHYIPELLSAIQKDFLAARLQAGYESEVRLGLRTPVTDRVAPRGLSVPQVRLTWDILLHNYRAMCLFLHHFPDATWEAIRIDLIGVSSAHFY